MLGFLSILTLSEDCFSGILYLITSALEQLFGGMPHLNIKILHILLVCSAKIHSRPFALTDPVKFTIASIQGFLILFVIF